MVTNIVAKDASRYPSGDPGGRGGQWRPAHGDSKQRVRGGTGTNRGERRVRDERQRQESDYQPPQSDQGPQRRGRGPLHSDTRAARLARVAAIAGAGIALGHLGNKVTGGTVIGNTPGDADFFHGSAKVRPEVGYTRDGFKATPRMGTPDGRGTIFSNRKVGRLTYGTNNGHLYGVYFQPGEAVFEAAGRARDVGIDPAGEAGKLAARVKVAAGRMQERKARFVAESIKVRTQRKATANAADGHPERFADRPDGLNRDADGRARKLAEMDRTAKRARATVKLRDGAALEVDRDEKRGSQRVARERMIAAAKDKVELDQRAAAARAKGAKITVAVRDGKVVDVTHETKPAKPEAKQGSLDDAPRADFPEVDNRAPLGISIKRLDNPEYRRLIANHPTTRRTVGDIKEAIRSEARHTAETHQAELDRWGVGGPIAAPPRLSQNVSALGAKSMVRGNGKRGEWDWFNALDAPEQRRIRRNWMDPNAISSIDDVSSRISQSHGGGLGHDEAMSRWVKATRLVDGGRALALGRPAKYVDPRGVSATFDNHDGINVEHLFGPEGTIHYVGWVHSQMVQDRVTKHAGHEDQSIHGKRYGADRGRRPIGRKRGGRTGTARQLHDPMGRYVRGRTKGEQGSGRGKLQAGLRLSPAEKKVLALTLVAGFARQGLVMRRNQDGKASQGPTSNPNTPTPPPNDPNVINLADRRRKAG